MFVLRWSLLVPASNKRTENKVSKYVGVLYKTSKLVNCKCLRSTYLPLIHPYINYANIVYVNTNKTKLKKLFGKQKQAAGIIFNQDRSTHARLLLKTLKCTKCLSNKLFEKNKLIP